MNNALTALQYHVTGAIERGEKEAIVGNPVERFEVVYFSAWNTIESSEHTTLQDAIEEAKRAKSEDQMQAEVFSTSDLNRDDAIFSTWPC